MSTVEPKTQGTGLVAGSPLGFAGFLLLVYVVPPLLIFFDVVPFRFRFPVLLITSVMVLAYVLWKGNGLAALGLRRDTLKRSLQLNLSITALALVAIAAVYFLGLMRAPSIPAWRWFFVFYVLLSCPAQEFLFRSALFAEMDRAGITHRIWQVAISSAAYCLLHVIYRDAITLGVTLCMGIAWGLSYRAARNLWGVTVSHCVLGTVSIFVGLI